MLIKYSIGISNQAFMSSRIKKLVKSLKHGRNFRQVNLEPLHAPVDNNLYKLPTEPRSMKQGRGWVKGWDMNLKNQVNQAAKQRELSRSVPSMARTRGNELQNHLLRVHTRVSINTRQGPKLPRREETPYIALNHMPITPPKTPTSKSKKQSRKTPKKSPGTPYERMNDNNSGTRRQSRNQTLAPPPKFII
jgi:hypothetical protein